MWTQMQKILNAGEAAKTPPSVPLRKPSLTFEMLGVGSIVRFSPKCPISPFTAQEASVTAIRHYRFGTEQMKSYQLQVGEARQYFLTVAEDEQGHYLSLSRALDLSEQDSWFGRDALSFFTEPSTAKTIRCKADLMIEGDWAAARYSKTVDWVEGSLGESARNGRGFHYNLLVNESGEKALEIEHDDASNENRVFVTVYRPVEDILALDTPFKAGKQQPAAAVEPPLFQEPVIPTPQPKQRPDFRRLDENSKEIHIERTPLLTLNEPANEEEVALPSFLLERETDYLSLDEVIPPEPERIRVGLQTARTLIERAMSRNVRVRDVVRDMLGLESALSEEVIFELPLSDADYRTLAMRYKLRPDHRVEIRARLQEELQRQLIK